MIHGHRFLFADETGLQQAYDALYGIETEHAPLITVSQTADSSFLTVFPERSEWLPLSGQEGRYLSPVPFDRIDADSPWALEIKNVLTLLWEPEKANISYLKATDYTPQRLRFWVFHTFFPMVLELGKIYRMLHVGAVEIAGRPILFSAPSFGGKSTLTDFFVRKGHPLYADDSLAIEKEGHHYIAWPSYPYHRPYRDPEVLGHPAENMAKTPKPVHALYLLEKSDSKAQVQITECRGIEKFQAFHYANFINFSFRKKERFDYFTEMAKHVPAYQISIPWDKERLPEVYEAIVKHTENGSI